MRHGERCAQFRSGALATNVTMSAQHSALDETLSIPDGDDYVLGAQHGIGHGNDNTRSTVILPPPSVRPSMRPPHVVSRVCCISHTVSTSLVLPQEHSVPDAPDSRADARAAAVSRSGAGSASVATSMTAFRSVHTDFRAFLAQTEVPVPRDRAPKPSGSVVAPSGPVRGDHSLVPVGGHLGKQEQPGRQRGLDSTRRHTARRSKSLDPPESPGMPLQPLGDAALHTVPTQHHPVAGGLEPGRSMQLERPTLDATPEELHSFVEVLTVRLRSRELLLDNERSIRKGLSTRMKSREAEVCVARRAVGHAVRVYTHATRWASYPSTAQAPANRD